MKSIRLVTFVPCSDEEEYPNDIDAIVRAFATENLHCTREQAREMWKMYSDSMAAGWMTVGDDADLILVACIPYFEEV